GAAVIQPLERDHLAVTDGPGNQRGAFKHLPSEHHGPSLAEEWPNGLTGGFRTGIRLAGHSAPCEKPFDSQRSRTEGFLTGRRCTPTVAMRPLACRASARTIAWPADEFSSSTATRRSFVRSPRRSRPRAGTS